MSPMTELESDEYLNRGVWTDFEVHYSTDINCSTEYVRQNRDTAHPVCASILAKSTLTLCSFPHGKVLDGYFRQSWTLCCMSTHFNFPVRAKLNDEKPRGSLLMFLSGLFYSVCKVLLDSHWGRRKIQARMNVSTYTSIKNISVMYFTKTSI